LASSVIIPLSGNTESFSIFLNSVQYNINVIWNKWSQLWQLDINDAKNNPILSGIPLVAGVDLLAPYPDLKFGGQLIAANVVQPSVPPSFTDLGVNSYLFFTTS
jgi:hypothetical protein